MRIVTFGSVFNNHILKVLSFVLQILIYSETFESSTIYSCSNNTIQPIISCVTVNAWFPAQFEVMETIFRGERQINFLRKYYDRNLKKSLDEPKI